MPRTAGVLVALSLIAATLIGGCARAPIRTSDQAMRLGAMPELVDDLEFGSLVSGLETNIRHLRAKSDANVTLSFGPLKVPAADYSKSLEVLLEEARADRTGERFRRALQENFDAYEVYGGDDWGEVFMTSYYEPVLRGSRAKSDKFTQPLYAAPKDLKARKNRGVAGEPGQLRSGSYYDRKEIDDDKVLEGQGLELAWVDPIDAFFLQIQGSGVVRFDDGSELRVGYAGQNGHPYVPIGKHLFGVIPKEKMSMQAIEAHLRSLPEPEMRKILNLNPSYVFFQPLHGAGLTFFGTEVINGRTIATDRKYFPKGALAFLEFEKPQFEPGRESEPAGWQRASRFVLDHDTGGAIRGPNRLDLFWGRGDEAKQVAGVMKNKGKLHYFVPKQAFLATIQFLRRFQPIATRIRQTENPLKEVLSIYSPKPTAGICAPKDRSPASWPR